MIPVQITTIGLATPGGGGDKDALPALEFARRVKKPVFIAEATPRGIFFDKEDPEKIWNTWFKKFFEHIEQNKDVIRAASYINADWGRSGDVD